MVLNDICSGGSPFALESVTSKPIIERIFPTIELTEIIFGANRKRRREH
jgi:hypothetical protein